MVLAAAVEGEDAAELVALAHRVAERFEGTAVGKRLAAQLAEVDRPTPDPAR